jgi:hypothetical protein
MIRTSTAGFGGFIRGRQLLVGRHVVLLGVGTATSNLGKKLHRIGGAALGWRALDAALDLAVGVELKQLGAKLLSDGDPAAVGDDDVPVGEGGLPAEGLSHRSLAGFRGARSGTIDGLRPSIAVRD